ncbi:MAG: UV DNA damage repair endonuclease UvsE [Desulfobacteraceae bacterium]
MLRLGLCCVFKEHPVKFRKTTAKYLTQLPEEQQKQRLASLCAVNSQSLLKALEFCRENKIGSFRINSQILPLKTHPELGYDMAELPGSDAIINDFKACGAFSQTHDIRTTFHPDQFIILSSPNPDVVRRSVQDLEYQAQVAEWVNADVINIHAGGVYGDKPSALLRLMKTIDTLPGPVRKRLTLENDDRSYSPKDLLPVCMKLAIPMVYDVHHHRCLQDNLSIKEATQKSLKTWDREPLFHISSPRDGWGAPNPRKHHDYINIKDLPKDWTYLDITLEVEAKGKELAIKKLMKDINAL